MPFQSQWRVHAVGYSTPLIAQTSVSGWGSVLCRICFFFPWSLLVLFLVLFSTMIMTLLRTIQLKSCCEREEIMPSQCSHVVGSPFLGSLTNNLLLHFSGDFSLFSVLCRYFGILVFQFSSFSISELTVFLHLALCWLLACLLTIIF